MYRFFEASIYATMKKSTLNSKIYIHWTMATIIKIQAQQTEIILKKQERILHFVRVAPICLKFILFYNIYFKKKEPLPTLQTLANTHEPTLKQKLCQRVQSCL